jgi:alkanesulfonate monooxygenase SsuD/methylene tetrahydromethanopterin reductase-like flavin-dependent oxidoreductase (luciferase family)
MATFGVFLGQDRPVGDVLAWGHRFDEAGIDSLWVADHLANPFDTDGPWYDGWTLLGALATVTRRCRLGPLVSTFVLHPPLHMARLAATVDALSAGRLDLGLGLGGAAVCRAAAGVADDGPGLADRFERGLETLLGIFEGVPLPLPPVPVVAGRGQPDLLRWTTPTVQSPHPPIVVGGQGPRAVDGAARHGDRWNLWNPFRGSSSHDLDTALSESLERFDERCAATGRPERVPRSILLDFDEALRPGGRAQLTDLVGRLYGLGFDECIAVSWMDRLDGGLGRSVEDLLAFVVEDLPALAGR